jgi:hypothetical protein
MNRIWVARRAYAAGEEITPRAKLPRAGRV